MLTRIRALAPPGRAADLDLAVDLAAGPTKTHSLASVRVAHETARLELHVLFGGHQAVLTTPGGRCSELVAAQPGHTAGLPETLAQEPWAGLHYTFKSSVQQLSSWEFSYAIFRLHTDLDGRPGAILGMFDGDGGDVIALRSDRVPAGIRWSAWHAFPATGELVSTRATVDWS